MSLSNVLAAIDRHLGLAPLSRREDPDRPRRRVTCPNGPQLHTCLGCGVRLLCGDFQVRRARHGRRCISCEKRADQVKEARRVRAEMQKGIPHRRRRTDNGFLDAVFAGEPLPGDDFPRKVCTGCHETKPLADFYDDPRGYLLSRSECKACICRIRREGVRRSKAPRMEPSDLIPFCQAFLAGAFQ